MADTRKICALGLVLWLAACQASRPADLAEGETPPSHSLLDPCTAPDACCESGTCDEAPVTTYPCGCEGLWSCNEDQTECTKPRPTPFGGDGWDCSWNEFRYRCSVSSDLGQADPLPESEGWSCEWNPLMDRWVCILDEVPNPTNNPRASAWTCVVDGGMLVCERKEGTPSRPSGGGDVGMCTNTRREN